MKVKHFPLSIAACFLYRAPAKALQLLMVQLLLKKMAVVIPQQPHCLRTLPRSKCGTSCASFSWRVYSASQQTNRGTHLNCFLRSLYSCKIQA